LRIFCVLIDLYHCRKFGIDLNLFNVIDKRLAAVEPGGRNDVATPAVCLRAILKTAGDKLMKAITILTFSSVLMLTTATGMAADGLMPEEQLGKSIFFDTHLSINQNQACAACHGPEAGWTGPSVAINAHGSVYEGSIPGRFGNRKPPSAAYATQSPVFNQDKKGLFTGGNFWDGRATGEKLGNPAADQAQGPFLNPAEQALPDSACVVHRVCEPVEPDGYPVSFEEVWGDEACDIAWPLDVETVCATEGATVSLSAADREKSDTAYDNIAVSIAAYEGSHEVNAFSSKYDLSHHGKVKLTKQEQRGFALFRGKGKCHLCHISNDREALFTDYTFDNLGTPQNPENPAGVAPDFVDVGLGGFLKKAGYPEEIYMAEWGKQKVPTLRNVDLRPGPGFVKAYGHNGYFKTLKGIVHFYNTRDVLPKCEDLGFDNATEAVALANNCWPEPEVAENVNTDELGDLGLTPEEEDAIVAFMKTLSDGFEP
jgi:cytochrome c peroxidase